MTFFRTLAVFAFGGIAATTWSGCSVATCNAIIQCNAPLVVTASLASSDAASIEGAQVTFCFNGPCVSSDIASGAATLSGPFSVDVKVNGTNVVFTPQLNGFVGGDSHDVSDGDKIEVQVLSNGNTLLDSKQTVSYTKSTPGCRDGACFSASLTATP